jgi:hypothetical protein
MIGKASSPATASHHLEERGDIGAGGSTSLTARTIIIGLILKLISFGPRRSHYELIECTADRLNHDPSARVLSRAPTLADGALDEEFRMEALIATRPFVIGASMAALAYD